MPFDRLNRREFITLLGGAAAAWPLAARAQQPAMPVIGFLHPTSPDTNADRLRAFRQGLKDTGYVEGENVAIEYRSAENQIDRLPALAAELARRQVAVIASPVGTPSALAAKAATSTIPIVFGVNEDPVKLGLVASLARPGGNATGINILSGELVAKRLELLRELVPERLVWQCSSIRPMLPIPRLRCETWKRLLAPSGCKSRSSTPAPAARSMRLSQLLRASGPTLSSSAPTPFSPAGGCNWSNLASHHSIPATYSAREFAEAGGLMSYGANIADAWRQVGVYTGRILKGAKPADLPVVQASKFELVINAETARMLGLTVPPTLLARADEVIE